MIRSLRPHHGNLPLLRMCQLLGVSRSLVYKPLSEVKRPTLLNAIEDIITTFLGYGYRRVYRELKARGKNCSEYEVRGIMRDNGLMARRPKSRGVTRPSPRELRLANLVKGLKASRPDEVWVGDTTLIRTQTGPVYLASLMDLYSRKIVGWHISRRNDEDLVMNCLNKALDSRRPAAGWIHHSDRGATYTSTGYVRRIRDSAGRASLAKTGCPFENAHAESFFRTLKLEEADRNSYKSFLEVETSMHTYIEEIYNSKRMHSSLGYASPEHFERRHADENV